MAHGYKECLYSYNLHHASRSFIHDNTQGLYFIVYIMPLPVCTYGYTECLYYFDLHQASGSCIHGYTQGLYFIVYVTLSIFHLV